MKNKTEKKIKFKQREEKETAQKYTSTEVLIVFLSKLKTYQQITNKKQQTLKHRNKYEIPIKLDFQYEIKRNYV